jgi:periplasmic protein TonB
MLFNNWNNPVSFERNQMVFANRNTAYGAYQLRTKYNNRVIIAFFATAFFFVGILMALWLPSLLSGTEDEGLGQITIDQQEINMEQKKEDQAPPPPPEPPKQQLIAQVMFVPPVIKNDAREDTTRIIDQEEVKDENVAQQNIKGQDDFVDPGTTQTVVEEKKEPEIFVYVSEMPEFPGGTGALYKFISNNINYPETAKEAGISGKCFLRFVVGADGKVGKVEINRGVPGCPECDREATRVVKLLPEFKPGKNNGQSVPVWFQLPINFTLK